MFCSSKEPPFGSFPFTNIYGAFGEPGTLPGTGAMAGTSSDSDPTLPGLPFYCTEMLIKPDEEVNGGLRQGRVP